GMIKPNRGEIFLNDQNITSLPMYRRARLGIGYLSQESSIFRKLTVEENLRFHGSLYGLSKNLLRSRIKKLADTFQIEELLYDFPRSLSHGFLKRAMLVRTLLHDPHVLLLDEPTAFLDARSRYIVWDYLQKLRGKKTVVYATQSIEEAERMHDRIVIMNKGKVVLDGTLDRLLESSGQLYHFQVHFDTLSDDVFSRLSKLSTLVNPSRMGQIFNFYARERKVLLEVLRLAAESELTDYRSEKLGLETLVLTSTEDPPQ
ncbi:MAG: ATP-binding cassette domain-containing protein, partial [Fidelibacterota bacterium]